MPGIAPGIFYAKFEHPLCYDVFMPIDIIF